MHLVWSPNGNFPLLQIESHQIFTSVLSIFKIPSSQMRQAGLINLSICEEGTQEEENERAFPVLCFNLVKGEREVSYLTRHSEGTE